MANLYELTTNLRDLQDLIESGECYDENGELNEIVADALSITQQELQAKAIDYGYLIKSLEDSEELFDKEIKRLQERKKQLIKTKEKLVANLTNAMQQFGVVEIKGKTLRLSFRKSEQVAIYDEAILPDEYKRTKVTIEPDKTKIKQDIKDGIIVDGAKIIVKNNLQIK